MSKTQANFGKKKMTMTQAMIGLGQQYDALNFGFAGLGGQPVKGSYKEIIQQTP